MPNYTSGSNASGSSNPGRGACDRGRLGGWCIQEDGLQVEEAISRGRRGGPGRSQFSALSDAATGPPRSGRGSDPRSAKEYRPSDRSSCGPLSYGHRSSHPGSPWTLSDQEPRAQRAGHQISARTGWRAYAHRHQEVSPYRSCWSSHSRRPAQPKSAVSVGSSFMWPSTTPHACLCRGPAQRKIPLLHGFPQALGSLVQRPRRLRPVRHVRQRLLLQGSSSMPSARGSKLRHLRTKPYRPQTNGKAERFIQTLLREWAYKRPYPTSIHRTDRLPRYLNHYNLRRPHAALNKRTPAQRLSEQPVEN